MTSYALDRALYGALCPGSDPVWRSVPWIGLYMAPCALDRTLYGTLCPGSGPVWRLVPWIGPCMASCALDRALYGVLCPGSDPAWRPVPWIGPCMAPCALDRALYGALCPGSGPVWRCVPSVSCVLYDVLCPPCCEHTAVQLSIPSRLSGSCCSEILTAGLIPCRARELCSWRTDLRPGSRRVGALGACRCGPPYRRFLEPGGTCCLVSAGRLQ